MVYGKPTLELRPIIGHCLLSSKLNRMTTILLLTYSNSFVTIAYHFLVILLSCKQGSKGTNARDKKQYRGNVTIIIPVYYWFQWLSVSRTAISSIP